MPDHPSSHPKRAPATDAEDQKPRQRQGSILITDLKGSTAFYRKHGNLAGRMLIQKHNALLFPVIQEHGGVVVATMGDAIIAFFEEKGRAIEAALSLQARLATYNAASRDEERMLIRVALSWGDCILADSAVYGYAVDAATALSTVCDAGSVLVTDAFLETFSHRADIVYRQHTPPALPDILAETTLYRIEWSKAYQQKPSDADHAQADIGKTTAVMQHIMSTPIIPAWVVDERKPACFYCGMTVHEPSRCPSKLLQYATQYLDRLVYLPPEEIRKVYEEHLEDYIKPLASGHEEQRYDILFEQRQESRFTLGFCSLYEISEIFQLRTLYRFFAAKEAADDEPYRPSGALLIGRDCLRVSRDYDADVWFQTAIKENPSDYRPYVDMGIIALERMDPSRAIAMFRKASGVAKGERSRRHINMLIARAYEIAGALSRACEDMHKILDPAHPWHAGLYYYGVLLAKLGKADEALSVFKRLCESSERYYLMLLLDPSLTGSVRDHIVAYIQEEYENLFVQGRVQLESIEKTYHEVKKYFSPVDPEYQNIEALFNKATQCLQEASFGGLLDMAGIQADADRLMMRAVDQRREKALAAVAQFSDNIARFAQYLEHYPYPRMISHDDMKLREQCQTMLRRAAAAADSLSLERLAAAQKLIEHLHPLGDRIEHARQRLDMVKNILFIVEFTYKIVVVFFLAGIGGSVVFVLVVGAFQAYSTSLTSFTLEMILRICRHGLTAGFFSGLIGAAVWFKRSFRKMFAKLGE
ncbi:MAG: adenylate/guanylate cyclase domain-containing protein [Desulfobacterota bacterium]|nr:adenylate/guanylate cyclase domain-containing protein [Thermodesulfobacteriota bacterium]